MTKKLTKRWRNLTMLKRTRPTTIQALPKISQKAMKKTSWITTRIRMSRKRTKISQKRRKLSRTLRKMMTRKKTRNRHLRPRTRTRKSVGMAGAMAMGIQLMELGSQLAWVCLDQCWEWGPTELVQSGVMTAFHIINPKFPRPKILEKLVLNMVSFTEGMGAICRPGVVSHGLIEYPTGLSLGTLDGALTSRDGSIVLMYQRKGKPRNRLTKDRFGECL